jgi:UPF0716 protein FxsA
MLRWAIAVLLLIPLVDILVLIYIATAIGAVATVALVVLTGLVGLLLVRAEGRHTLRRLQRKLTEGEAPADELLDGGLLIAAGAFLLTPGIVTDLVGLVLVVPPTRALVRSGLKRYVVVPAIDERTGGFATGEVYTFGFPDEAKGTESVYDLGSDAYDIDGDDGTERNA